MPMPEKTREHGHMLGLYIGITLSLINDGHKPPAESFRSFLQASLAFIEKTKQEPNNHVLLEEIRKAADASIRRKTFIEEQITAIKNSKPTSNQSYANVASQGAARKSATGIPPSVNPISPPYNKANEIVIKLNDKDSTTALSTQSPENTLRDINHYLQAKNISHTDIRAARKLKSGDIAIHTANEIETQKLVEEESWTQVLGKKACIVTQTFGVVAHAVRIDSISMKEKEGVMKQIRAKNTASIPDLEIKWIGWLSNPTSGKKETSLVIECKTATQANGAIEEGLAIGAELHRCTLYNPACKQKQCFNCQQYGHLVIHCTNTQACGYCAAAHRSQDCKKDAPKKCILCKRAHETWDHRCEFKKKELERIRKAKEGTPARYEIRPTTAPVQAPLPLARSRLSAFQGIPNIPSLSAPRTNKRPVASRSQSPTKRPTTTRETRSNTADKNSADQIPLSTISSSRQARKRQNGKVQVFEGGNLNLDPESSQAVVLSSLA